MQAAIELRLIWQGVADKYTQEGIEPLIRRTPASRGREDTWPPVAMGAGPQPQSIDAFSCSSPFSPTTASLDTASKQDGKHQDVNPQQTAVVRSHSQ